MALAQKQISAKKQATLIVVMFGVILITISVLYYFFFWGKGESETPVETTVSDDLSRIMTIRTQGKSSLDMLESLSALPAWQRMKKFGRYPLPLVPRGNPEPFKTPSIPEKK